jgi:hypothetical protein
MLQTGHQNICSHIRNLEGIRAMLAPTKRALPPQGERFRCRMGTLALADPAQEALDETDIQVRNTQTSPSTLDNAPLITRKVRIGADILRLALRHFCNDDVDHGARQWVRTRPPSSHLCLISSLLRWVSLL